MEKGLNTGEIIEHTSNNQLDTVRTPAARELYDNRQADSGLELQPSIEGLVGINPSNSQTLTTDDT